jgi:hypothetical protein
VTPGEFSNVVKMRSFNRDGRRCQVCGKKLVANVRMNMHHRRDRSMGGTSLDFIGFPSNALTLCGSGTEGCHGRVTVNRTEAFENGWAVRANTTEYQPAQVPVKGMDERGNEQWYFLRDDFSRDPIPAVVAFYQLLDLGIRSAA